MDVPILPNSVSITLNGSGAGTARIGPESARETWNAQVASVHVATTVVEAQCRIFVGTDTASTNYRDGTLSGSTGDSTDRVNASPIPFGQWVWAVWTGGDAGSMATLAVTGTKTI